MTLQWQNLIYKRCPDCNKGLREESDTFFCDTPYCAFVITIRKMTEILTDKNHPALLFMNGGEEDVLMGTLRSIGIEKPETFVELPKRLGRRTFIDYCQASGKPTYDKRGAVTALNKQMEERHIELRAYPCNGCQGWHLTKIIRATMRR